MCDRALAQWSEPAGSRRAPVPPPRIQATARIEYQPLQRVLLTEGVANQMFSEYAEHRGTERGGEEIGWVLLGHRDVQEATVLATLPAGAHRDAGEAHIRFDSTAQAVASRIVRQLDRRLVLIGIVHTHPGSLRHPSDGDYRGDIEWVGQLRGEEGIFGIGTAETELADDHHAVTQPRPNIQAKAELRFSWYSLARGAANYRPIQVELVSGPDLAQSLRHVWRIVEDHASRLERLAKLQTRLEFEVTGPAALCVRVPLEENGTAVRVLLTEKEVKYFVVRDGVLAVDLYEPYVDRGVYRLLADLAGD